MPLVNSIEKSLVRELRATPAAKATAKSVVKTMAQDSLHVAEKAAARSAGYVPAPITRKVGRLGVAAGNAVAEVTWNLTRPILGDTGGRLVSILASGPVHLVGLGVTLAVAGGAEVWKKVSGVVGRV